MYLQYKTLNLGDLYMKFSKYIIIALFSAVLLTSCKSPDKPIEDNRIKIVLYDQGVEDPYLDDTKLIISFFTNEDTTSENLVDIKTMVELPRSDTSFPNGTWDIIESNYGYVYFDNGGEACLAYGTHGGIRYYIYKGKLTITDKYIDIDVEAIIKNNVVTPLETIEKYRYEGNVSF
jgi:hypothetical protein